jgi:hypothetical protein
MAPSDPTVYRPTSLYPRLKYAGSTMDFRHGVADWLPSGQGLRGANFTSPRTDGPGKIEYLYGGFEEACQLTLVCAPAQYAQLRRVFQDSLVTGTAFEVWIDRFTASCWLLSETLRDQNGLPLSLNTGTAAYVDVPSGRGLDLASDQGLSVAIAQASAGTPTGYDDPIRKDEGVLLLDFWPDFAAGDGTDHVLIDTTGTTANRLRLTKTAADALTFEILDAAAGSKTVSGTPTWAAEAHVEIVLRWTTAGDLQLWYAVDGGAFTALTTAGGAGTGILGALGTSLHVGSDNAAADFAPGIYEALVIYTRAFANPHHGLRTWRATWRTYFGTAEVTGTGWQPVRHSLDPQLYIWPLTIRLGAAA